MSQSAIIVTLLVGIIAAVCGLIGVVYTANRKGRTDEAAQASTQRSAAVTGDATVRVAVIAAQESFETRLITQVQALQKQVDSERKLRQDTEDRAREDNAKMHTAFEEMKHQVAELTRTVKTLQAEKILQAKDYQDKIIEQDTMNFKLQAELAELAEKYKTLQKEYEELLGICNQLRQELATARGQAIENVLTIAKEIGAGEVLPARKDTKK